MATCGAILLVLSQRVRCTLPHNHDGLHSFELDMGKRSRKASLPYQDDGEADNSDDSDVPKKKVKKAKKATSGGGASTSSSGVTWAPSRSATWQITVPKKIKIPAGKTPYSAEVKMTTLSNASGARHADKRGRIPFCWGGLPNQLPGSRLDMRRQSPSIAIGVRPLCCCCETAASLPFFPTRGQYLPRSTSTHTTKSPFSQSLGHELKRWNNIGDKLLVGKTDHKLATSIARI
jgi:hypothetical protein